jgi:hypothetical protein
MRSWSYNSGISMSFSLQYSTLTCLPRILLLDILNSTSAFNTANGKSSGVREAANSSCLPFQRTLQCLVDLRRLAQVDDIDISICRANNQKVLLNIQCVDSFLHLDSSDRLRLAQVPVLYSLIPRTRNYHGLVRPHRLKIPYAAYRLVVYGNLGCGVLACA